MQLESGNHFIWNNGHRHNQYNDLIFKLKETEGISDSIENGTTYTYNAILENTNCDTLSDTNPQDTSCVYGEVKIINYEKEKKIIFHQVSTRI